MAVAIIVGVRILIPKLFVLHRSECFEDENDIRLRAKTKGGLEVAESKIGKESQYGLSLRC